MGFSRLFSWPVAATLLALAGLAACHDGPSPRSDGGGDTAGPGDTSETGGGEDTSETGHPDDTGETGHADDTGETSDPDGPGVVDLETAADAKLVAATSADEHSLADIALDLRGDVNGDGHADVLLGFSRDAGVVYLVLGPVRGTVDLAAADARLSGRMAWEAGAGVGTADLDLDGYSDLVVGAPGSGVGGDVLVVYGPVSGESSLSDAELVISGEEGREGSYDDDSETGASLATDGDADGDGRADLLLGAHGAMVSDSGAAYLLTGPWTDDLDLATDGIRIEGRAGAEVGYSVAFAGDTDGDGLDDIFVAQPATVSQPVALLFAPPPTDDVLASDAPVRITNPGGGTPARLLDGAGDTDGDGFADLLVSDHYDSGAWANTGAVYLLRGPLSGEVSLGSAAAKREGERPADHAGVGLAGVGDMNGDGLGDVAVGAPRWGTGWTGPGVVWVVLGPMSGTIVLTEADAVLFGSDEDWAGWPVAGGGDVNGDGLDDLVVGGPGDDDAGTNVGAAWLEYAASIW